MHYPSYTNAYDCSFFNCKIAMSNHFTHARTSIQQSTTSITSVEVVEVSLIEGYINNMSACPPGYEHDTWFVNPNVILSNIGSSNCTLPTVGVDVVNIVLCVILIILCVLLVLRGIVEVYQARRSNYLSSLTILASLSTPFLVPILLLRGRLSTEENIALLGASLVPLHLSILFAVINITRSIPTIFAIKMTEGQRQLFTKDMMIRINIVICISSTIAILLFWSILLPLQSDPKLIIAFYRIGCFANTITIVNYTVITWKSCSILLEVINQVQNNTAVGSVKTSNQNANIQLNNARKKFIASQSEAVIGLGPAIIWLIQGIFVSFYWYLVIFHVMQFISYHTAMVAIYPFKLNHFKALCFKISPTDVSDEVAVVSNRGDGSANKIKGTAISDHNPQSEDHTQTSPTSGGIVSPLKSI